MSKELEVEFQELGDLGGLDGEVSGEIRIPLMDSELEDEDSTLDEPVWTTLVSKELNFVSLGSWVGGGIFMYVYFGTSILL